MQDTVRLDVVAIAEEEEVVEGGGRGRGYMKEEEEVRRPLGWATTE